MYIYIYIYDIYSNLPKNAIFIPPNPQRGDNHSQEKFLGPSADKKTRN